MATINRGMSSWVVKPSLKLIIKRIQSASLMWSLKTVYHFLRTILSYLVPVCAAMSFFKSPTVSSGLHFTRTFFPNRSLQVISNIFQLVYTEQKNNKFEVIAKLRRLTNIAEIFHKNNTLATCFITLIVVWMYIYRMNADIMKN